MLPLIALLLDRGANPNARDEQGLTPLLHLAKTRARFDPNPDRTAMNRGGHPDRQLKHGETLPVIVIGRYRRSQASSPRVRDLL